MAGMYPVPLWAMGSGQEAAVPVPGRPKYNLYCPQEILVERTVGLTWYWFCLLRFLAVEISNLWTYLSFKQIRSLQAKWRWLRVHYFLSLLSGKGSEAIQQHFRDHTLWSATADICAKAQAHCGSLVWCCFGADQVSHICTLVQNSSVSLLN